MYQVGFTYSKVLIWSDEVFQFHDTLATFSQLTLCGIQVALEGRVLMNELRIGRKVNFRYPFGGTTSACAYPSCRLFHLVDIEFQDLRSFKLRFDIG
jgi:hypothetical protein